MIPQSTQLLDKNENLHNRCEPLTNIDVQDLLFFEKNEDFIRLEDYIINSPEGPRNIASDPSIEVSVLKRKNEQKVQVQTTSKHKKLYKRRKDKQCKVCDKNFTTTTKLNMHTRIHSGCKPFKCTECSKTFSQEFNLKRHELIHLPTSQRPRKYQCHICGQFYWQKHHLTDHILACHSYLEKEIVCDVCKKAVKNKNSYRLHRYRHVIFMENEV